MAHRNARLTPLTRLELVREVDAGWPQAEVARHFRVSRHTVAKWLGRFRAEGAAGLEDRSSAPRAHPRRTPPELERRICAVRRTQGFGPHRIQWALGVARSTVYAVLRRRGLNRLDRLHRVTREPVRYEHDAPGDLLHLDVKKLGRVPRGRRQANGAWLRRDALRAAFAAFAGAGVPTRRRRRPQPLRLRLRPARRAWRELRRLPRAGARGLPPAWRARAPGPDRQREGLHRRPQLPRRRRCRRRAAVAHAALPPADERQSRAFHPDPAERVAYARPYRSNAERLRQLPRWLYRYNHRRPHGGVGGAVPASRL